jgi:hypothetical protein
MSDCYTAKDVNFTNSGSNSMITGLYRPALARVWHGMLLLIGTQGKPGKPAAVKARMYDPYAGGFTPMFPLSVAGPLCVAGPALFYADLFTWIFYSDGTNFVCASAPQPAPNSQNNNQLPFDDFQFGPASVVAADTTAINPTVILFNGQVYVFWTDAPPQGTYNTIYVTSAPYQPSADGTTAPTLLFGPVSQLQTFVGASPISEPSLAVYNGSLYCAYCGQNGVTQVLTLGPDLVPQPVNTGTADCGALQCTHAPAIAADPKGTFLAMVFCKFDSTQLCTTYLPVNSSVWTAPQLINKQLTNLSPTLITTGGNLGYIGYSCTDGTGTNLTVSGYLPNTLKNLSALPQRATA